MSKWPEVAPGWKVYLYVFLGIGFITVSNIHDVDPPLTFVVGVVLAFIAVASESSALDQGRYPSSLRTWLCTALAAAIYLALVIVLSGVLAT